MSDLTISDSPRPGSTPKFRLRDRNRSRLICEALETRQLLSITTSKVALSQLTAQPNVQVLPFVANGPTGLSVWRMDRRACRRSKSRTLMA